MNIYISNKIVDICVSQNLCDKIAWPTSNIAYFKSYWNFSSLGMTKRLKAFQQIGGFFLEIKLKNYVFILHKLNILFIYIQWMSMHVI